MVLPSSSTNAPRSSSSSSSKLLVVLALLEGRHFPRRPRHRLLVEARFDAELLASDPVAHSESPTISQELAWQLDKKSLRQHRLQKTSIKVTLFAVDADSSSAKEQVGYLVIPLRSAGPRPAPQWHSLLSSKYSLKTKPEIRVGVYVDDADATAATSGADTQSSAFPSGLGETTGPSYKDSTASGFLSSSLTPTLDEDEGWYSIGPKDDPRNRTFLFSITVAFAANLVHLLPSNVLPRDPDSPRGFFFFYSLFGNSVTTDPFPDAADPDFPTERASVRIRCSIDRLRSFFRAQPGIEVHLCYGAQSLGKASLPFGGLVAGNEAELFMQPVNIEETYRITPHPTVAKTAAQRDDFPMVGVALSLKLDERPDPSSITRAAGEADDAEGVSSAAAAGPETEARPNISGAEKREASAITLDDTADRPPEKVAPQGDESVLFLREGRKEGTVDLDAGGDSVRICGVGHSTTPTPGVVGPGGDSASPTKETPQSVSSRRPKIPKSQDPPPLPPPTLPTFLPTQPKQIVESVKTPPSVPPSSHHFSCSVDLRSFHDLKTLLTKDSYLFFRYHYPFFGFSEAIHIFPAIKPTPFTDTMIPNGFCAFDFASPLPQLEHTFHNQPFMLELWGRSAASGHPNAPQIVDPRSDALLGVAKLPLLPLLQSPTTIISHAAEVKRRSFNAKIPVVSIPTSAESQTPPLGEVAVFLCLDDLGFFRPPEPPTPPAPAPKTADAATATSDAERETRPAARETPEYKAALELELWKETQKEAFEESLKRKEQEHLQAISEEYKRRERERELTMRKRIADYSELETRLRETLADLEARQKTLLQAEKEAEKFKEEAKREHQARLVEVEAVARRKAEDFEHKIALEKKNSKGLEDQIKRLQGDLVEAGRKLETSDKALESLKLSQQQQPEVVLQREVNKLTAEISQLEKKLEAAAKSKAHYKQQWGRALKELARFKQKEAEGAKERLRIQEHELEHLRLRYLVAEERGVSNAEHRQMQDLKEEIAALKLANQRFLPVDPNFARGTRVENDGNNNNDNEESNKNRIVADSPMTVDEDIARLVEERDALLQTGVYSDGDRVIRDLDRRIKEKMARGMTSRNPLTSLVT